MLGNLKVRSQLIGYTNSSKGSVYYETYQCKKMDDPFDAERHTDWTHWFHIAIWAAFGSVSQTSSGFSFLDQ